MVYRSFWWYTIVLGSVAIALAALNVYGLSNDLANASTEEMIKLAITTSVLGTGGPLMLALAYHFRNRLID
jgi:hypothetical protein